MKVPSLSKTESVLLIGGVVIAAYLAYRLYTAGGSITDGVKDTAKKIGDIFTSAGDAVSVGAASAGSVFRSATNGGDAPQDPNNQSDEETARLKRQEQSIIQNAPAQSMDPAFRNFDPETFGRDIVIGQVDNGALQALPQYDSPDATGRATDGSLA